MAASDSADSAQRPIVRALSDIAYVLESDKDVEGRIQHVLEQLQRLVPYDRCALLGIGVKDNETLAVAPKVRNKELEQIHLVLRCLWDFLNKGFSAQEASGWRELSRQGHWKSRLAVPLVGLDEIIGVLAVGSDAPDVYDEHHLQLLSIVAAQSASYLTALQARRQELAQEQLARSYAEDEKRRLETFLAMLSHELRNPLAPICSCLEILRLDQSGWDSQQEALAVLERQVGILTRLIDDLLEVCRVTTEKIQLQLTEVELNALTRQVADLVQSTFLARQQELNVALNDSPIWIHGDPVRLEQILINLLGNATKFTQDGGRAWLIVDREEGEAVIRVRDSGMGMEASLQPHVFDLFTQGGMEPGELQPGLGIGLALVKSLVEMHGGTVTATSAGRGRGSEFVVRLPFAVPYRKEQQTQNSGELAPQSSGEDVEHTEGRLRVLMVDDSRDAVHIQSMLLRHHGYEVETALDGPTALQTALNFCPDVVVLDIGLPGMNGYEVAQCLRQENNLSNAVLIAVTGFSQLEHQRRVREAGFDHHLVKPAVDSLLEILSTLAEERKS